MNEIVNVISNVSGLSRAKSKDVLDAITTYIRSEVVLGNVVKIVGFGKWLSSVRPARNGINPKTMEKVLHKETKTVRFVAGTTFKRKVRG